MEKNTKCKKRRVTQSIKIHDLLELNEIKTYTKSITKIIDHRFCDYQSSHIGCECTSHGIKQEPCEYQSGSIYCEWISQRQSTLRLSIHRSRMLWMDFPRSRDWPPLRQCLWQPGLKSAETCRIVGQGQLLNVSIKKMKKKGKNNLKVKEKNKTQKTRSKSQIIVQVYLKLCK